MLKLILPSGKLNQKAVRSPEVQVALQTEVQGARTWSERAWCYVNQMTEPPKCTCGNYRSFRSFAKGYGAFCSSACANKHNAVAQSHTKQSWGAEKWDEIKSKATVTNIERYGVKNPFQSEAIKERIRETVLEKYGVEHTSQIETKRQKTLETNRKKYGVDNPSQCADVVQQRISTVQEKYGDCYRATSQRHIPVDVMEKLSSPEWLESQYYSGKSIPAIAWVLGVDKTVIQDRFAKFGIEIRRPKDTKPEVILMSILDEFGVSYIKKDRKILGGLELDVYIPELKLAIEYNGNYHHSFNAIPNAKQKNKHHHKFMECQNLGIELIQLTGERWDTFRTFIRSKTGNVPKIHARKCIVKEINHQSFSQMLDQYHLQGSRSCRIKLGLFYNECLVGVMGFNPNKKYGWELARMVFGDYRVVGGASKMLTHFIRQHSPTTIVSYSANAYSNGNVYRALEFVETSHQKHDLWYSKGNRLINRQTLQKHKLINILDTFDPKLTEQQNLLNNGYRVYYGPGTKTWVLHLGES